MIIIASVGIVCFLGGWNGPFAIPYMPFGMVFCKTLGAPFRLLLGAGDPSPVSV